MLPTEFERQAASAVDLEVAEFVRHRDWIVADEAKQFLVNVIHEALRVRAEEGRQFGFRTEFIDESAEYLRERVRNLLQEASLLEPLREASLTYGRRSSERVIGLINVMTVVHLNWCRIWPFCRT